MKKYIYTLLSVSAILAVSCTEIEPETPDVSGKDDYESFWYLSYEASRLINSETLGYGAAADFCPYTVAHVGDTLFVANIGTRGSSLMIFDASSCELVDTLASWDFRGTQGRFTSQIEAIVPVGDRLYVSERQSLIHVFGLPGLEYISCIGNGLHTGPVFQAQALEVVDSLIFARDKSGEVSIYKVSDCTPENYRNIFRYRRVSRNGSPENINFRTHFMKLDENGHIMMTDYERNRIRVLDPALVTDTLVNGTSIDIDELEIPLTIKPRTFALCGNLMYATAANEAINVYDRVQGRLIKSMNTVKGYTFSQPGRIYAQSDSVLWVSDISTSKRTLVKVITHKGEVRE